MTRSQAKAAGLRHYDQGRVCPRKHLPVRRLTSTGSCCACQTEHMARYYSADPAKFVARTIAWQLANPDKARVYELRHQENRKPQKRAYRLANVARISKRIAAWQKANPLKRRANEAKRRAAAGASYTEADIAELFTEQAGICVYCPTALDRFHVDHITPICRGGRNDRENLQLLCEPCNLRKGRKTDPEFRAHLAASRVLPVA